jgi:hypothetical protein
LVDVTACEDATPDCAGVLIDPNPEEFAELVVSSDSESVALDEAAVVGVVADALVAAAVLVGL